MLEVNLKTLAVSQTTAAFNSMCKFGDEYLGATSAGLFKICGYSDGGVEVPCTLRSGMFDLGTERNKRIAYFYLGLETTGDLELDLLCDGEYMCTLDVPYPGEGKREIMVKVPRGLTARYWAFELRNVDGSFFALYSVKVLPVVLQSAK
jgi:hypothetical protein